MKIWHEYWPIASSGELKNVTCLPDGSINEFTLELFMQVFGSNILQSEQVSLNKFRALKIMQEDDGQVLLLIQALHVRVGLYWIDLGLISYYKL